MATLPQLTFTAADSSGIGTTIYGDANKICEGISKMSFTVTCSNISDFPNGLTGSCQWFCSNDIPSGTYNFTMTSSSMTIGPFGFDRCGSDAGASVLPYIYATTVGDDGANVDTMATVASDNHCSMIYALYTKLNPHLTAYRVTDSTGGNASDLGEYLKVGWTLSYNTRSNNSTSITPSVTIVETTNSGKDNAKDISTTYDKNKFTVRDSLLGAGLQGGAIRRQTASMVIAADKLSTFAITLTVTDKGGDLTKATATANVGIAYTLIDLYKGGKGIAIGTKATQEGLEIALPIVGGSTSEDGKTSSFSFPVGAVYISVDSTSPASLFGGTWEQIEGRFMLTVGGDVTATAGTTGGSLEHNHKYALRYYRDIAAGVVRANTTDSLSLARWNSNTKSADGTEIEIRGSNTTYNFGQISQYDSYTSNSFPIITTTDAASHEMMHVELVGTTNYSSTYQPYYAVYAWHRVS